MSSRGEIKKSPLCLTGGGVANKGLRQQATRGVAVPARREESRVKGKEPRGLNASQRHNGILSGPFHYFFSLFLYLTSNDLDIRSVHLIFFVGVFFRKVSNFSTSICLY